jgi:hypothetical protein
MYAMATNRIRTLQHKGLALQFNPQVLLKRTAFHPFRFPQTGEILHRLLGNYKLKTRFMKLIRKDNKVTAVPLDFVYNGTLYAGEARPLLSSNREEDFFELDVTLNAENLGTITCGESMKWTMRNVNDQGLIDRIGEEIALWYD